MLQSEGWMRREGRGLHRRLPSCAAPGAQTRWPWVGLRPGRQAERESGRSSEPEKEETGGLVPQAGWRRQWSQDGMADRPGKELWVSALGLGNWGSEWDGRTGRAAAPRRLLAQPHCPLWQRVLNSRSRLRTKCRTMPRSARRAARTAHGPHASSDCPYSCVILGPLRSGAGKAAVPRPGASSRGGAWGVGPAPCGGPQPARPRCPSRAP